MKPAGAGPPAWQSIHIWDEEGRKSLPRTMPRQHLHPQSLAGIVQTLWGDPHRFVNQYYRIQQEPAEARIGALGPTTPRTAPFFPLTVLPHSRPRDDVINVAGHRLGTGTRSACLTHS